MTLDDVIPYLLKRKLIAADSLVDGDVVVKDASRRNQNFKVIIRDRPGYLLKQGVGPNGVATVRNEAAAYHWLLSASESKDVSNYLPRWYGYDAEADVLALELLPDAENLREYHSRLKRFPARIAAMLGEALATLHRLSVPTAAGTSDPSPPYLRYPWLLSLHQPSPRIFKEFSAANLQIVKILQQFSEFGSHLDVLREEWRSEALIHNDLKWDNCVAFKTSAGEKLKLLDWELATMGDPCWDVGAIFMDYLNFWLLSIPITGESQPDRFLELARFPLGRMQPAIRKFWKTYTRHMGFNTITADEHLRRAVKYAAARLIQTAFEEMQMSFHVTGNVICLLQLSLNMFKRPQEAAVQLLGIPFRGMELQ